MVQNYPITTWTKYLKKYIKGLCACVVLLIFTAHHLQAKGYFNYSASARQAYDKIVELRFEEARNIIASIKTSEPENLIVHHLEDYIDFFTIYINEDKAEYNRLYSNKSDRLAAIQSGDSKSPYYLYLQADVQLHWALISLKFGNYYATFTGINRAFKLLEKNMDRHPDFIANKKDLGMLHAMVSTIPDTHKGLLSLVTSISGTFEQGQQELEEVIEYARHHDFVFEAETYILYAYVMLYFGNESEQAWQIVQKSDLRQKQDPMSCFVRATIAMKTGRNDQAIQILSTRNKGAIYFPYDYLDFMLGQAKLRRLDIDADMYLEKYLQVFKGRNYIKEAYRMLAWHELTQNRIVAYEDYMQKVRTEGYEFMDNDKSALKEANAKERPDPIILKARLLLDGGYYQRAFAVLQTTSVDKMLHEKAGLEYTYFMGRITHQLQRYEEALKFYEETIEAGRDKSWYFACRAALERGIIFEQQGQYKAAKAAFQACLSIRPSEHRFGLHQKAKAGLARLR
ncbi:MAG: tetratricopeptide repeat protein [Bacteroidota bacterium]